MTMHLPQAKVPNDTIAGPNGEPVIMIDLIDVRPGEELVISLESSSSDWRQGLWIATTGALETNNVTASQMTLWTDTAPNPARLRVVETDGWVRLHNVWDSGRGISDHESQSATSGMLIEERSARVWRYRCNDIGWESNFDKLVFSVAIE